MGYELEKISAKEINIKMPRGDSAIIPLTLKRGGENYTPVEGDSIRFAMKKSYKDPDDQVLINKAIPIDTLILEIEPSDTKELPMGKSYVYDIEFVSAAGEVDTFVEGIVELGNEVI